MQRLSSRERSVSLRRWLAALRPGLPFLDDPPTAAGPPGPGGGSDDDDDGLDGLDEVLAGLSGGALS